MFLGISNINFDDNEEFFQSIAPSSSVFLNPNSTMETFNLKESFKDVDLSARGNFYEKAVKKNTIFVENNHNKSFDKFSKDSIDNLDTNNCLREDSKEQNAIPSLSLITIISDNSEGKCFNNAF